MTQCFILTQEISKFQTQVELLEQCLCRPNAEHEIEAEMSELANTRQISRDQLKQEIAQLRQKLHRISNLNQKFGEKVSEGQLPLLYLVKSNFLLKEILEMYWDFLLGDIGKEFIKDQTSASVTLYKALKSLVTPETPKDEIGYVVVETLKHSISALIKAGLRVNAFSQGEVNALDLGDITPQESETVLVFLSTMKKWEPIYKRLAAS
jgi:hypothetical protein